MFREDREKSLYGEHKASTDLEPSTLGCFFSTVCFFAFGQSFVMIKIYI